MVRIPVSVKPEPLVADEEVSGVVPTDAVEVTGVAGFTGDVDLIPSGLVGSTPVVQDLEEGPFDPDNPEEDADTFRTTLTVPEGGAARFRVDGAPSDDLDLWVYLDGTLVAFSATGSADEEVTGYRLPGAEFEVFVNNFDSAGPTGAMQYDQWAVGDGADAGNLTLDPDPLRSRAASRSRTPLSWDSPRRGPELVRLRHVRRHRRRHRGHG